MSSIPAFGPASVSAVSSIALAAPAEGAPTASCGNAASPARDFRQPSLSPQATAMLLTEQNRAVEPAPSKSGVDLSGRGLWKAGLAFLDPKGADLRGANLANIVSGGQDWSGTKLCGADLCGATLARALAAGVIARGAHFLIATIRDAGLDRPDFTGADFGDAPVEHVYVRAASVRGAHDRVTGGSLRFTDSDVAGPAMANLSVESKGRENSILGGMRFAGTAFDCAGFVPIDLTKADLGFVHSAQFPGLALNNMMGLDLKGFYFVGQFLWSPAGRRRIAVRSRRRRETRSHRFLGLEFEHAFF